MANEITLAAALSYMDSESENLGLALPVGTQQSITTKRVSMGKLSVAITDTTIPVSTLSALGYFLFINRDPTNIINIKTVAAGTIILKLDPVNGFAFGRFGSGITAPVAIASVAICQMDFMILNT